jgi:hypothetical protein
MSKLLVLPYNNILVIEIKYILEQKIVGFEDQFDKIFFQVHIHAQTLIIIIYISVDIKHKGVFVIKDLIENNVIFDLMVLKIKIFAEQKFTGPEIEIVDNNLLVGDDHDDVVILQNEQGLDNLFGGDRDDLVVLRQFVVVLHLVLLLDSEFESIRCLLF